MIDHDALVAAFSSYSHALLHSYDIGHVLYRLSDQALDVLGIDGAAVSVVDDEDDDGLTFVSATSARFDTIETTQDINGIGPCHDAFRTGEQITVVDLAEETRWPTYRRVALDNGCRSVAGLPMPIHDRRIGALNLYRDQPHEWETEELHVGQVLANMAAGYIINHAELSESRTVARQLQRALDSRVVIEQAKGMLAARRNISPEEAFDLLRRHARSTNTRLHALCQDVVDGNDTEM